MPLTLDDCCNNICSKSSLSEVAELEVSVVPAASSSVALLSAGRGASSSSKSGATLAAVTICTSLPSLPLLAIASALEWLITRDAVLETFIRFLVALALRAFVALLVCANANRGCLLRLWIAVATAGLAALAG